MVVRGGPSGPHATPLESAHAVTSAPGEEEAEMEPEARFDEIVDDLLARHGDVEKTQMMGMPAVKRNGKLVVGFVRSSGEMTFKLSDAAAHADALALDGARLFDPSGRGRPFKEWVQVPAAHAERWPSLAERALDSA